VKEGLYFHGRQWAFRSQEEAGRLPGGAEEGYWRVPTVALLVVGPVLGLAYVVFLPFLGVAMVTWLLGVKGVQVLGGALAGAVHVLRPGWEPALAYFSRSKPATTEAAPEPWVEETRKKVEPADAAER
jgi:hypothetical protein